MDYEKKDFKPLKTPKYKDATNGWIDPDGNLYRCGYMDHNMWAMDYLQYKWKLTEDFIAFNERLRKETEYGYAYSLLNKQGWMRLLTWRENYSRAVGYTDKSRPNKAQEETLYIWCSLNNYEYDKLFQI